MGFYVAIADSTGARISASEQQLLPAPTRVEYPTDPAGQVLETADGRAIQQQPSKDSRRRAWIWANYPEDVLAGVYRSIWNRLQSLRARYRVEYGAGTPYVWVKEDMTKELRRQDVYTGTATGGGSTTLSDTNQTWQSNALTGYEVEIIAGTGAGQVRTVASNGTSQVTVTTAWSVNPSTNSVYVVRGWIHDWFKARVIEVSRKLRGDGGPVRYDETRFVFVIEDANWNYLG